jgi:hypothetical protein
MSRRRKLWKVIAGFYPGIEDMSTQRRPESQRSAFAIAVVVDHASAPRSWSI